MEIAEAEKDMDRVRTEAESFRKIAETTDERIAAAEAEAVRAGEEAMALVEAARTEAAERCAADLKSKRAEIERLLVENDELRGKVESLMLSHSQQHEKTLELKAMLEQCIENSRKKVEEVAQAESDKVRRFYVVYRSSPQYV